MPGVVVKVLGFVALVVQRAKNTTLHIMACFSTNKAKFWFYDTVTHSKLCSKAEHGDDS
jgi:hypothetical protein